MTTCVRKFGRNGRGPHERTGREHITGSRMASSNGHEVLLCMSRCQQFRLFLADHGGISAYSADGIYLYSTKDDPGTTNMAIGESSIVLPNEKGSPAPGRGWSRSPKPESTQDQFDCDISMEDQLDRIISEAMSSSSVGEEAQLLEDEVMDEESSEAALDVEDESLVDEDERPLENRGDERYSSTPTIFPRARFGGICNVETIKDGAPCIVSS